MSDRILFSIGEALIDMIPSRVGCSFDEVPAFSPRVGGAPANVCAAVARLGGRSALLSQLGDDPFGHKIARALAGCGVELSHLEFTSKASTALAFVSLAENGERTFSFCRKPSADLLYAPEQIDPGWFSQAFALHFCSVSLVDSPMRYAHLAAITAAREAGAILSFDPNLRFPLWPDREQLRQTVWQFLPLTHILKLSDEELPFLTGTEDIEAALPALFTGDVQLVLFTCGSKGARAWAATEGKAEKSLKDAGVEFELSLYPDQNTYERAKEHALQALTTGCQVIVGIGGGRIMDQAKATAHFAGDLPIVEVPTSIATCAAFAPLSVMYTAEGASLGSLRYDHEVNAIVMDMDVICKEPPRYAASGIMDGMAKMIEIQNGRSEILLDDVSIGLFTAYTIAEMAYHVYEKEAHQACHDIAEGKLTKAVEDIAYLNVAVAGIVSGVSKGFGQTALGHETYELVRTHFTQEAKPYLHGEIVAIGDCLQLAFNGHPEQVAPFRAFMRSMNMPLTLEDIGIDPNSPKMENLFQDLFHSPFMEPTAENEARLRKAMHYLSAD